MSRPDDPSNHSQPAPTPAPAPAPAPAPPPAPLTSVSSPGFDPKGHRIVTELVIALAVLLGLGVAVVVGGGALAAGLTPLVSLDLDRRLGALGSQQIELTTKECQNPAAKKYVEELAAPLLTAAAPLPFEFEFRVADDPSVNAFALPGGFVTVNRGLLEAAESGEEVAGVLGHEIQHALLRHGTKRILRELGGGLALSILLGGSDLHQIAQVASRFAGLDYDRDQESEADREGASLLLEAGVDPAGLATFFERLQKDSVGVPELLSTHPDPGNRAAALRGLAVQGSPRKLPPPSEVRCN